MNVLRCFVERVYRLFRCLFGKRKLIKLQFHNGVEFVCYGDSFGKTYSVGGKLHREDGPAMILSSGTKMWYRHAKLHREGGPAIVWNDGREEWYQNGNLHLTDGPAVKWFGYGDSWYCGGKYIDKTLPFNIPKYADDWLGYWRMEVKNNSYFVFCIDSCQYVYYAVFRYSRVKLEVVGCSGNVNSFEEALQYIRKKR